MALPPRFLQGVILASGAGLVAQTPIHPNAGDDQLLATLFNTPIEATSKRPQSLLDSPQAVEVLTAAQIRASGVFRLIDVLKLMTSVQVDEFGKDFALLAIRGTVINAQRFNVKLLVDGVPIFNTESGTVHFNNIPLPVEAIERVEVVRGPSSSLYGANAQAGVIAITTRKAQDGVTVNLRGGAAGKGTYNAQGFLSYGSPRFNVTAGLGNASQQDSGLSERVLGGTRQVDPLDQNHASQVFFRPEVVLDRGRIWAMVAQASSEVGPQVVERPSGVQIYRFPYFRSSSEAVQVGWSQAWSPAIRTELQASRVHLRPISVGAMQVVPGNATSAATVPILQSLDPGLMSAYDITNATTDQLSLQVNWDPNAVLHLVFGLDTARLSTRKALIAGLQADEVNSASGGFLSLDWRLGPTTLSLGARIENDTQGGPRVSPRATLVYSLLEDSVLRAGYFTSTRSPTLLELAQDVRIPGRPAPLGNPDLKPETFDNIEIGFRKSWTTWNLDITAYHMTLRKVIASEPTGAVVGIPPNTFAQIQQQNGEGSLTNTGLEVSLKGELRPGWFLGCNATTRRFNDETGAAEAYAPRLSASLWTRFHHQAFQAFVALQEVGAYRMVDRTNIAGPSENGASRLQIHFKLGYDLGSGFQVSLYGINAARASDESTAGSTNNSHLIRSSRREVGLQASYRF